MNLVQDEGKDENVKLLLSKLINCISGKYDGSLLKLTIRILDSRIRPKCNDPVCELLHTHIHDPFAFLIYYDTYMIYI